MRIGTRRAAGVLAAIAITAAAAGQTTGRITGRVSDGDGGHLAGAVVEAVGAGGGRYSTSTDDAGRYAIPNLPPGSYTIHFRMEGYAPVDKKARVPLDGRATVDAKLFKITG